MGRVLNPVSREQKLQKEARVKIWMKWIFKDQDCD